MNNNNNNQIRFPLQHGFSNTYSWNQLFQFLVDNNELFINYLVSNRAIPNRTRDYFRENLERFVYAQNQNRPIDWDLVEEDVLEFCHFIDNDPDRLARLNSFWTSNLSGRERMEITLPKNSFHSQYGASLKKYKKIRNISKSNRKNSRNYNKKRSRRSRRYKKY
jgi:hypothetical protein